MVDDDEFLLDLMVAGLERFGAAEIAVASNGAKVLSMMDQDRHFDVILTDLNMPEMDGVELMRHLAERRYAGGVVLLTGENSKLLQTANLLAKAHKLNLLGVLQKPFSHSALEKLLLAADQRPSKAVKAGLESDISKDELGIAIREGQIVPYYQPRITTGDGGVNGVETLARWLHPERGMVMPGVFVPLAEQMGLTRELSQLMLRTSVAQIGAWRASGLSLKLSANVTAEDLLDVQLPDCLDSWCATAQVPLSDITLELTESQLMSQLERTLDTLIRLRLKGVNLAVDDFGTGYSNMGQIKRAPFSELKIDRSFVVDAMKDEQGRAILQASITMGRQLGLSVVAEGVETESQWDLVCRMGADEVQGYLFSPPLDAEGFVAWLRTRNPGLAESVA